MTKKKFKYQAVDLFCGVGGLTHGLRQSGIPVVAGFDIESSCAYAYEHNNNSRFICKDIQDISSVEINELLVAAEHTIMVGCAPCQTFSTHTQKIATRADDKKWDLINVYLEKILSVKPTIVSMENVPGLRKFPIYENFIRELQNNGYNVSEQVVFCPEYGISQSRKRLVVLASKLGEIRLIPPTHSRDNFPTVKQIIGHLPAIAHGEADPADPLHRASALSDLNLRRMRASKPGGTWLDWPESLRSPCHRRDSGSSYRGVYARMVWNSIAPTMTTQFNNFGTGRFGHPQQDRSLSIREGALIQTFPENYQFFPPTAKIDFKKACRMIGNAVPVRLGEIIGLSILSHLKSYG